MPALFIVLGIAVLTLLALLLWFVPHLLQQQAIRTAGESAQLREMLLDVLNEQETVALRQSQLGTSLSYLQDQLEQLVQRPALPEPARQNQSEEGLRQIEQRLSALQQHIETWMRQPTRSTPASASVDEESWNNLMSLLNAIQTRVGELTMEQERRILNAQAGQQARQLLEELEREVEHLNSIADDITRLQWRLRQSLHGRDIPHSVLRSVNRNAQVSS